ncbi:class I SAM-dependent methyltransferase [Actibacterium sp. MT2.3-13A]|uniref:SAM-dependent methyltransferase n=1 Tax=Actibacterium sp. MT2.3-13A TaxID=2828332 RepID=UPI001BABB88B|nr:class I SAM-dependent methyltransferase [Actibacterium sp. MT2.3-13A]
MWNERYATEDYLFGTEPAAFVTRHAHYLAPGARVLSVADGEGRNAVWLAGQGMDVTAMDGAPNAVEKARRLAATRGVRVDFHVADIVDWDWDDAPYDAVLAVFIQFAPPAMRDAIFAGMARALRPGGLLMLHGYGPRQLGYGTGGPGKLDHLYTTDLLRERFAGFEFLELSDYDAEIHEGLRHSGRSALVDCVARKPR